MSRPLLGLLLATVVFFALWVTMLKPHGSDTSGNGTPANPSLGQLSGAVAAAHSAVNTANAASAAHGGVVPAAPAAATPAVPHRSTPATHPAPATHTASATKPAAHTRPRTQHRAVHHAAPPLTAPDRLRLVATALRRRQVLAMLFYNPPAADDRQVRRELATIPTHHGAVVKLAIPLRELASYSVVTQRVPVTGSPTLVIVDPGRGATEVVGFSDRFEIAQRIADALAVH